MKIWLRTKTHLDDTKDDKRSGRTNFKKQTLTRNDKMTSNNNARVLKRDVGNTKGARSDMNFFVMNKRSWTLRTLDTMLENNNKYIKDIEDTRVKNILYCCGTKGC